MVLLRKTKEKAARMGDNFSESLFLVLNEAKVVHPFSLDSWAILKDAANKDAGMDFIAFSSLPENQAKLPEFVAYGLPSKDAASKVPEKYAAELPTTAANMTDSIPLNVDFWIDHSEELTERFNAWLAK